MRRKNKGWEVRKVNVLVQQTGTGRGSGGKDFADAAFFCALIYHPSSSLSAETGLFGNKPKALMKAGREAQRFPGSQGPLSLKAIGFLWGDTSSPSPALDKSFWSLLFDMRLCLRHTTQDLVCFFSFPCCSLTHLVSQPEMKRSWTMCLKITRVWGM